MNPKPAEVLDLSPVIETSPQKKQRCNDVPKTVEFSNYEVSSPEASDTNTINIGSNMNPEPAEVLNLSPVIERNASIELSPGISEKEYDFFTLVCTLETVQDFFVQVEHEITYTFIGNYTFFSISCHHQTELMNKADKDMACF